MLKREGIDKLCAAVMALAVVLTLIFMNGKTLGADACVLHTRIRNAAF